MWRKLALAIALKVYEKKKEEKKNNKEKGNKKDGNIQIPVEKKQKKKKCC